MSNATPWQLAKFPSNIGLRKRRYRIFGATQLVWDKLERTAGKVVEVRARSDSLNPLERMVLAVCDQKVGLARDQIDRFRRYSYSFWDIIHQVDELLLLAMPPEMLYLEGVNVFEKFDRKVRAKGTRAAWLGSNGKEGPLKVALDELRHMESSSTRALDSSAPGELAPRPPCRPSWQWLARALARLSNSSPSESPPKACAHASDENLQRIRETFRSALHVVNEQGDVGFWRLGTNVSIQVASSMFLLALLTAAVAIFRKSLPWTTSGQAYVCPPFADASSPLLSPIMIFMLGAAGAVVSNMLRDVPFVTSVGPTARYFIYYLFAKPVVGGFTALLILWLERSQLFFEIAIRSAPPEPRAAVLLSVGSCMAAGFARAVIAVAAGFAGDRLLGSMVGQVLNPLWRQAEKASSGPGATGGQARQRGAQG